MKRKEFSIKRKMYVFVVITVLAVAFGTSVIAFRTSANQIDNYYKQNTADNARNFASLVDGDYLARLKEAAASDEFQELREKAEEEDNEAVIEEYLKEKGLWEDYSATRSMLSQYLKNMDGIKYLYIVAHGDADSVYDMYLIDDDENPIYETGYLEEREEVFMGKDIANLPEPTISHGDWGWLCSDFKPVYASDGSCVCIVGCDIGMDDVMQQRAKLLIYLIIGALIFTAIVLTGAVLFINKTVVNPLKVMTTEMKRFNPTENPDYEEAGVINLDIKSRDEIGEIYQGIRSMQINIIDQLSAKIKAENDIKDKEKQIGQLSIETYLDALTGVGNKAAYLKKIEELNTLIAIDNPLYAFVMVDVNNLKQINDVHGHEAGDKYITGCCHMVCEAYKHSPVYRIGGDEFAVILLGTDFDNRINILENLRAAFIKSYSNTGADPWDRYSAATGMAENSFENATVELVFKQADKAMYEDKERFKKEHGGYR